VNGSAPAGSGMYVPHALEFRIERVWPARLRRQFAGPRPVAVSADLLKGAGHRESLWTRRRYRSISAGHKKRWPAPQSPALASALSPTAGEIPLSPAPAVVGAEGVSNGERNDSWRHAVGL
jgi:hypothetical protein